MREENKNKLEILRIENLKKPQTSSIIYIESERDVTLPSK
jgi:hypothetical protein